MFFLCIGYKYIYVLQRYCNFSIFSLCKLIFVPFFLIIGICGIGRFFCKELMGISFFCMNYAV